MAEDKIGFANKYNNYGAEIVGDNAPGNPRPWYTIGQEDAPINTTESVTTNPHDTVKTNSTEVVPVITNTTETR